MVNRAMRRPARLLPQLENEQSDSAVRKIRLELLRQWQPANETEHLLVDTLALAAWRVRLAAQAEDRVRHEKTLRTEGIKVVLKYAELAQRSFNTTLRQLRQCQAARQKAEATKP
jgi:hypothetical protein